MKYVLIFLILLGAPAFAVTGSITDPGFSSSEREELVSGPLKGSWKARFSRGLRRSPWKDFLSSDHRDGLFDGLLIATDLSLSYPLIEIFPSLKNGSFFDKASLFLVLSYSRPGYDVPQVIRSYCFQSYLCFGETSVGVSNPLPKKGRFSGGHSVYLNIPTSRRAADQKKFLGAGVSLNMNYSLLSEKALQVSALSSHFFDGAVYGSRHADEWGSASNDVFSVFNQAGLRFAFSSKKAPVLLAYISHLAALDYRTDWFQKMSLGLSSVWPVNERVKIAAGFGWGGAVFLYEHTAAAKEVEIFNPDETRINGGFIYAF